MAKMLSQNDWNFNNIGTKFELDEVIPKFETEVRADANGEIIKTEMVAKDVLIPIKSLVGNTMQRSRMDNSKKENQPKSQ